MQDKQQAQLGFVPSVLPWFVASGAFLIYLATLNHWVTLSSLPYVAKVTGWDWSLPLQAPLFYLLTYPIRWLPSGWQPVSMNLFAAVCSALTLALLARSVALLPHDRTLAQRQRERSEFSFLTIPAAWLPPVFAALVCGLQLTFWEHSTAATNESLDLLLFAYLIRCLLEFRVEQRESWLVRLALVYGLGVTNNWALIGFFPCFLIALIWVKGTSFFAPSFILRMIGCGLAGLLMYLLLPLFWALSDGSNVGFWQALRAELGNQKGFLFDTPQLRSRVLVLSLASILPILIMGVRWPSSFGDTSAAGAALTNLMFRVIHIVFLATCLSVFFDQKFSPRALGYGLPFLTFYYLGALGIGYFSGYVLLVFSEAKTTKTWKRRSAGADLLDRLMIGLLWIAFIAVPGGLIYKNWKTVREGNGPILAELAEQLAAPLPAGGALVLSDDPSGLMLLEAQLNRSGSANKHLLVHSRSLSVPEYHAQLTKRYPQRWPNIATGVPDGEIVEDAALLLLMMGLGRTNDIYYLHPSFGFYFEHFYPQANGLVYRLSPYPTNQMIPPPLGSAELATNQTYWTQRETVLKKLQTLAQYDSADARYVAGYYSRALNFWGVALQRGRHLPEAGLDFKLATELNTNNRPALVNLDFNKVLRSGEARVHETFKSIEEKFGLYRSWEKILYENGPFDHPDFCFLLGDIFRQQSLYRQAAIQFDRIQNLEPTNILARLALANVYLEGHQLDKALETAAEIKAAGSIGVENELELARLEAAAYYSRTNLDAAQKVLVAVHEKHPDRLSALDALVMFYGKSKRFVDALETVDRMLKIDPGNASALINQATLYFNQTNHTQAQAALDRLLQKEPKNIQALLYKVFMHTETKDYPKAMVDVDRILEFEPDNQEALLYQGVLRIETKNHEQAMKPLNRLLKLQPDNWKALRNRAIANLHRGKLDEAKADYETLRKNLPRYYIAYYGLAEIAYRLKDVPNAIKYYELYLKYVPNLDSPEIAEEKKMVNGRLSELKAGRR